VICPKCGKEIIEGHMYCEDCGCEINLVPEFEAKVEEHISDGIQSVVEKADLQEAHATQPDGEAIEDSTKKEHMFYVSGALIAILVFLFVSVLLGLVTIWRHSSFVQEMLVEYYIDDEKYEQAISYLEETVANSPEKISLRFKLCDLYMSLGEHQTALDIYDDIADDTSYSFEERVASIERMISYYTSKKNYSWIAKYLNGLEDEKMQMAFLDYMVSPVMFSQTEGTYTSLITLKLTSNAIGTIYYTTDGTKPTKNSTKFMNTIFLEPGENVISAMFVNDYGVSSDVITKKYVIESKRVSPPEVLTYSGTYHCPVKIEIQKDYQTRVYYTTDGTSPSTRSQLYTGNLYLPVGKSVYKFIAVGPNGDVSDVVTREYQLQLDTTLTIEQAKEYLIEYLVGKGNQTDGRGHILQENNHILVYEYLYPMSIDVGTDCYYFAEVLRDTVTEEQSRTNCYYGVDFRTNRIYLLSE